MGEPNTNQPRIYVACLAAYNNGYLHGAWIDAARRPWALWQDVQVMLSASPIAGAEEWAIHDYEGFAGVRISEHESFETVAELAAFVIEHGPLGAALLDHFGGDLEEARDAMTERHLGSYTRVADYIQEVTEEALAIPTALRFYIDWEAMARDGEMSGIFLRSPSLWTRCMCSRDADKEMSHAAAPPVRSSQAAFAAFRRTVR